MTAPKQHDRDVDVAARARSPASRHEPGDLLADRFEILSFVATGGMGTVYRARDVDLDEIVAIKILRRDLDLGPSVLERFRREVKLSRRVTHHNVARVFDIHEHGFEHFLVMELVDGEPLSALLAREGAQPVERILAIAAGVCDGLAAAHAAGIVHRDLKPENILVTPGGRIVITDFGIARHLYEAVAAQSAGLTLGTPAYMAPEQVENGAVDARADIYALGAVLYELFTGQRAWTGDSAFAVAAARLLSPPPDPRRLRPDMPDSYAETVLRSLARRPDDRFGSADEVRIQLCGAGSDRRIAIPMPTTPPQVAAPAPTSVAPRPSRTIAVLFFRNRGPNLDDYLAEELTDDLIDGLSATGHFRVRPRGVVLRFAEATVDPVQAGQQLGVEAVIDGTVRRYGERVRIDARLITVSDGFQVWAKRFDRLAGEVLEINDALVRAVSAALSVEVVNNTRVLPTNAEAIDLFLRGRHELRKLWPESLSRAIELFDKALDLAPDAPLVLAAKATALARRAAFSGAGLEDARIAAERAVELGPDLAEAHLALGNLLIQQGDAAGGVREITRVIAVQPALADAHATLGRILTETELLDDGIRHLELAISFDADHPVATAALARGLAMRGDFPGAYALLDQHLRRAGRGFHEGARARLTLWERDAASADAQLADLSPTGEGPQIARLLLHAAKGDLSVLHAAEERARGDGKRRNYLFQVGAECRARIGDREGALAAIEQFAAAGFADVAWLDHCPLFADLREGPRFVAARAQVAQRASAITRAYQTSLAADEVSPPTYRSGALKTR